MQNCGGRTSMSVSGFQCCRAASASLIAQTQKKQPGHCTKFYMGMASNNSKHTSAYSNGRLVQHYCAANCFSVTKWSNKMQGWSDGSGVRLAHSAIIGAWVQMPNTHIRKRDVTGMPVTSTCGGKYKTLGAHWPASLTEPVNKAESNTERCLTSCSALQLCVCRNACICTLINIRLTCSTHTHARALTHAHTWMHVCPHTHTTM